MVFAVLQMLSLSASWQSRATQWFQTTLAKEKSDCFGAAIALVLKSASLPTVKKRFLIMCSLTLVLIQRRKALSMEANSELHIPWVVPI